MKYVIYSSETGELSEWGETPDNAVYVPVGALAMVCPDTIDPGPDYHVVEGVLTKKEESPPTPQAINGMTFTLEVLG